MNKIHGIRMLVTDLDGTLLDSRGRLSPDNFKALESLGQGGICRVLATGRSMFSLKRALPQLLPVDYIVFSTGAGILDMRTGQVIRKYSLDQHQIIHIADQLTEQGLSFMLHHPVPDNHHFLVYKGEEGLHADFKRRMAFYPESMSWLEDIADLPPQAAQFLLILAHDEAKFASIAKAFVGVQVIRTTSPIDHQSMWLEIFPLEVSKGKALQTLMDLECINASEVLALGNDYNDVQMLEVAGHSFLTENAPDELKQYWPSIVGNDDHALSELVDKIIHLG